MELITPELLLAIPVIMIIVGVLIATLLCNMAKERKATIVKLTEEFTHVDDVEWHIHAYGTLYSKLALPHKHIIPIIEEIRKERFKLNKV